MKRLFIVLMFISLIGCGDDTEAEGKIVLDGGITTTIQFNDVGCFHSAVKNVGDGVAYNVGVTIQVFNSSGTIIDTALGFPADLSNIHPGQRATFDACAFDVPSSAIARMSTSIECLNR